MTSERQTAYSGTREVAEPLRFDVARLESYLAAHLPGFAGPALVTQFKGGQSNPTYLIETPMRRYVLRRKPPGKLLPSAHAVDREHRVISTLYAAAAVLLTRPTITGNALAYRGLIEALDVPVVPILILGMLAGTIGGGIGRGLSGGGELVLVRRIRRRICRHDVLSTGWDRGWRKRTAGA